MTSEILPKVQNYLMNKAEYRIIAAVMFGEIKSGLLFKSA
jgi:hypothetical protein